MLELRRTSRELIPAPIRCPASVQLEHTTTLSWTFGPTSITILSMRGLLSSALLLPSVLAGSVTIDLSASFNNKATSRNGENDGVGMVDGETFPIEYLPSGLWINEGVEVRMTVTQ